MCWFDPVCGEGQVAHHIVRIERVIAFAHAAAVGQQGNSNQVARLYCWQDLRQVVAQSCPHKARAGAFQDVGRRNPNRLCALAAALAETPRVPQLVTVWADSFIASASFCGPLISALTSRAALSRRSKVWCFSFDIVGLFWNYTICGYTIRLFKLHSTCIIG